MKNSKTILVFVFLALALFILPNVSAALEVSNPVKIDTGSKYLFDGKEIDYNNIWDTYKPIEIKSNLGIPLLSSTKAELYLDKHDFSCGTSCSSTIILKTYETGNLIDDIKFYTIDGEKRIEQPIRSYKFYIKTSEKDIEVEDYSLICTPTGEKTINGTEIESCKRELIGTHIEKEPIWTPYIIGTEVSAGVYEVKLGGQKRPDRTVDWQILTNNIWTEDWAIWNGSSTIINDTFGDSYLNTSLWTNGSVLNTGANWSETDILRLYATGNTGLSWTSFVYIKGKTSISTFNNISINLKMRANSCGSISYVSLVDVTNESNYVSFGQGNGADGLGISISYNNINPYTNYPTSPSILDASGGSGTGSFYDTNITFSSSGLGKIKTSHGERTVNYNKLIGKIIRVDLASTSRVYAGELPDGSFANLTVTYTGVNVGNIFINSPANNYTSPTNSVNFNCTAIITVGETTLTNMSLWFNESGTWKVNKTVSLTQNVVDAHGVSMSTSGVYNNPTGVLINTTKAVELVNVSVYNSASSQLVRLEYANRTLIKSVTIGTGSVADFNVNLSANTEYYILVDESGGGNYNLYYATTTLPILKTNINYVASWDGGGNDTANIFMVKSVETREFVTSKTQIFTESLYKPTLWSCQACDSDGVCGFATENRTVNIDTQIPTFVLNSLNNRTSLVLPTNVTLNVTTIDNNLLATCGYHTNDNATNVTYTCNTSTIVSFTTEGAKTITVYGIDVAGNLNQTTYPTNIYFAQQQSNATATVTEGELSYHNLQVNMTGISSWPVSAYLIWNNTIMGFGTVTFPTANIAVVNRTIIVPNSGTGLNPTITSTWVYTIGGSPNFISNISGTQSVKNFFLAHCDASITHKVLNITFLDETTLLRINATMDASSFTYSAGGATGKTFSFSNATVHNLEYDYCITPASIASLTAAYQLQYSHSESATYPQRRTNFNETLSNSSITSHVMYLLNYDNGITSNYQVITVGNQVITGARIVVTRVIGGNIVVITDGYTDASGQISFFLNPNFDHTFTVTATGFAQQSITIRPSQAQYTITMGTQSNAFLYTDYGTEGISYTKWPPSGMVVDGMYNFTFQVSNQLTNNIYNCTMRVYYPNRTLLASAFGCNSPSPGYGGKIGVMINMTPITSLYGEYYVSLPCNNVSSNCTGFNTYYFERDARWKNVHYTTTGGSNLRDAVKDLIDLPEWGDCPGGYTLNATDDRCYDNEGNIVDKGQTTDFSKIVFFFLFLAIVLAILNFYTGYDTAYPGAFIYIMTGIVFLGSAVNGIAGPGYFYLSGATNHTFFGGFASVIDNWILFIHFFLLTMIYFFTTNKRYQSG
jgi:hypothetical protein